MVDVATFFAIAWWFRLGVAVFGWRRLGLGVSVAVKVVQAEGSI